MRDSFEIRLGGSGGQGLQLSAKLMADVLIREGWKVARSQSYEPTSRGGLSRADLVVGRAAIDYPLVTALDYLVLLDPSPVPISMSILHPGALVVADSRRVPELPPGDYELHSVKLSETALALGNERVTNIVALGVLSALCDACAAATLEQAIREGVPQRFVDLNLRAFARGLELGRESATVAPATV